MDANEKEQLDDIQFDDVLDFEELKNKIKANVAGAGSEKKISSDEESDQEKAANLFLPPVLDNRDSQKVVLPEISVETNVKKYVVHVDPDNIDFMEHLSVNERRRVINKVLREQSFLSDEDFESRKHRRFVAHLLIAFVTFAVSLPLLFVLINKTSRITIQNYNESRSNFSKLYKEQGKIQRH